MAVSPRTRPIVGGAVSSEADLANEAAWIDALLADKANVSHTHPATGISDSTAAGRALLTAANAAAQRTALGLDTAAQQPATAFATAAQGAKADTAVQPDGAVITDLTARLDRIAIGDLTRPGENPEQFSAVLTGEPEDRAPLSPDGVDVDDDAGALWEQAGSGIVAPRRAYAIEASRVYRLRVQYKRTVNSDDPSGDAVQVKWRNLSKSKATVSTVTINTAANPLVATGIVEVTALVSKLSGVEGVTVVPPSTARYGVPYVETFGDTPTTGIIGVEWTDVTGLVLGGADVEALYTGLAAETDARESADTTLTNLIYATTGVFASRADAMAATIPALQTTLSLLDPLGRKLDYVERPGAAALTTNGGTRQWAPALIITANHCGLAPGDGAGNDDAFETAVAYAYETGADVVILSGVYGVDNRMQVTQAGVKVNGKGAEFYAMDGIAITEPIMQAYILAESFQISGVRFNGMGRVRYGLMCRGDRPTVDDCEFMGCGTDAGGYPYGYACFLNGDLIAAGYMSRSRVTNCRFWDCDGGGVGQYNSWKAIITECHFANMGLEMITVDRSASDFTIISDCHGDNLCILAGVGGIGIDGGEGWSIDNTTIMHTQTGADSGLAVPGICVQNNLGDSTNGKITDCLLAYNAAGAIRCRTTAPYTSGGVEYPGGTTVNILITGCQMYDNNGSSVVADAGTTGTLAANSYGGDEPAVPATWRGKNIAFLVRNAASVANVTGDGSYYTVPFATEVYDKGSTVSSGVLTFPRPGIYRLDANIELRNVDATHTYMDLRITTSTGQVFTISKTPMAAGRNGLSISVQLEVTAGNITSGITASVSVRVGGGAAGPVVNLHSADSALNFFTGDLIREAA